MRKFLSLALALCMVFSLSTVAFADASGYSTTVTYAGTGTSEWELNVPSAMVPGETKEVTLEGSWDSATVFTVKADEKVTMGNDIDSDVKDLAITFNTIEQQGNNYDTISVTEDISVEDLTGILYGNWKGVFNYYLTVDKAEVVNELEQDADGNYLVSTADDLFTLSEIVNSGENNFDNKTIIMTKDIDLENRAFTPIGHCVDGSGDESWDHAVAFNGTFDGQENIIYNLNVTAEDQDINSNSSSGLFGAVLGGTIKNLTVEGAKINSTHFAGVIAGVVGTSKFAYIKNCHVINATVTSTYYNSDNSGDKAGILVGCLNGNYVENSTATNSVVVASRDAGQLVGAGKEAKVTGCIADNVEVKWNGLGTGANIRNELIGRLF